MTLEEFLKRLPKHLSSQGIDRDGMRTDLRSLILTESERAADLIDDEAVRAHQSGDDSTIFRLHNARDAILRTSPGKGGG